MDDRSQQKVIAMIKRDSTAHAVVALHGLFRQANQSTNAQ